MTNNFIVAPSTVYVVDDDDSFRTSLRRMLQAAGFEVLDYPSVGEFLLAHPADTPGCVVLDVSMPGPSGIDLIKALAVREIAPSVIFVTGRDDVYTTVDVMKAGALDYIVKPVSAERLLPSVRRALEADGARRAARRQLEELLDRFSRLSPSERAIFWGITRSRLNKQLAAELGACERTIKAQRARMMAKLGVMTLPELVKAAALLERARARRRQLEVRLNSVCEPI